MRAFKAVRFGYKASRQPTSLLEEFRLMCNDAIRIAIQHERESGGERVRSRFALIAVAYPRLKAYGLHTHYIVRACEVAFSVYKNKHRRSDPYVKRAFLKLDVQAYSLDYLLLRIPLAPGSTSI